MYCSKRYLALCLCFLLASCVNSTQQAEDPAQETPQEVNMPAKAPEAEQQLPARFQHPVFMTDSEVADETIDTTDEFELKVGATIRSTGGPQPLWDIMKRLANLKNMTVSWSSDVDINALVDVDINAEDNFFDAIDNLLRQVDYFHEVEDKTIVVRYKDTKTYQIAIPQMAGNYATTVGGNFLTDSEANNGTEGTVKITSNENKFDIWENIKRNMDTIIEVWSVRREVKTVKNDEAEESSDEAQADGGEGATEAAPSSVGVDLKATAYYTIDESVGLLSVTAPRPVLDKVDLYINNLKKELYRQVSIEAKIIEVYLQDNSKIGLDWSAILKDFSISGTTFFGTAGAGDNEQFRGQVYPWIPPAGDEDSITTFVSKITLNSVNFNVLLNALNEQGDANVLSNPKLTVLNGQPALISVGRDIAYIKTVSRNIDNAGSQNETITYTAEVDNVVEGVALGVMPSIVNDSKVVLHLTPITTDLLDDPIEYRSFGDQGLEVGLPRIGVREMSTMVEVENGEMLVIGGLIDKTESTNGAFAPVVGDIPIIKYLFGYEEKIMQKRELVILLTPTIL